MSATNAEALNDIVQGLTERPEKILVMAKIVKTESYFKPKHITGTDWLRYTFSKFSSVPNMEWVEILIEHSKRKHGDPVWTEDALRTSDR